MSNRNSFLGLDRFIWWVGTIVNREDPLFTGRCQVRIFGWHTDNKQMLPDGDLPWAMPLMNNAKTFSSPKVGDWVFGFFMDGESAQFPVYMGVFPYVVPLPVTDDDGFNPEPEAGAPQLPDGVTGPQPGQSSVALLAQGQLTGTGVAKSDSDRIHICDITAKMNFDIAKVKLENLINVSGIRAAVQTAFAGSSSSPLTENIKGIADSVKAQAKLVKEYTDTIEQEVKALKEYTDYLQNLINTIESMPAEAQKMFAQCLADAKSSLAASLKS